MISPEAVIGKNVTIKENVVIEKNVVIEDGCYLDYGCIIRENTLISSNSYIGANSIVGEFLFDFYKERKNNANKIKLGRNSIIRSGTVIYGQCDIGENFQTGHNATIREYSIIGHNVSVGTNSDIQGNCKIGNYVRIHSGVFIAPNSQISNYVWIMPYVTVTNDPYPPSNDMKGVFIDDYVVIAAKSVILPGIKLNKHCLVGAGSVVTKDLDEGVLAIGNPAKVLKNTEEIFDKTSQKKNYPWPQYFDRGMPWEDIGYDEWIKQQNN